MHSISQHSVTERAIFPRNLRLVLFACLRKIEPHFPSENTACGMENVLIFQEMLDFCEELLNTKKKKNMFLYRLFNTVKNRRLNYWCTILGVHPSGDPPPLIHALCITDHIVL